MSYVTNVVVWVSLLESDPGGDEVPAIQFLNAKLEAFPGRAGGRPKTLLRVDEGAGGSKHINCYLYAAGINFLPHDEFLEAFHGAPWKHPEMNVLLIRGEGEDVPLAYRPGNTEPLGWIRRGRR